MSAAELYYAAKVSLAMAREAAEDRVLWLERAREWRALARKARRAT